MHHKMELSVCRVATHLFCESLEPALAIVISSYNVNGPQGALPLESVFGVRATNHEANRIGNKKGKTQEAAPTRQSQSVRINEEVG